MRLVLTAMALALLPAAAGSQDAAPDAGKSPPTLPHKMCSGDDAVARTPEILAGYGSGGFAVTTKVPAAQAFFDNGMQLGAAFAHKAAIAAFQEAVRLDPDCAMCLWGEAWASGPTINYGIESGEAAKLAELLARAEKLPATDTEHALIAALKLRFPARYQAPAANLAFARAMDAIAAAHPADNALATLAADAWMVAGGDQKDFQASANRALELLTGVLTRDPDYTPAIHFYIHATEWVKVPERATPYADKLAALAPKASHLVHMPSHTYYWIGRYQDAADANMKAVALGIDNARRLGMPQPDGVWDLPYHAHNVHFGVGGAMMSGDVKTALALSDPLVARAATRDEASVFMQMVAGMGYFAEGRFAETARVLALPEPKLPFVRAYWHYARGEAQARLGDAAGVRAEAAAIPGTVSSKGDGAAIGSSLARIARLVLTGRAAMLENQPAVALKAFRQAAALQESVRLSDFSDPPLWWYPVRRSVAEALLVSGDAAGALGEAEATLKLRPQDPMTLAVRARAQAALGNAAAAAKDRAVALRTWRGDRRAFAAAEI
jgi:tetratricopeptide (TPR) repeat protein